MCDLIKSWFRVLPGGMFPAPHHIKIMDVAGELLGLVRLFGPFQTSGPGNDDTDLDSRLANVRSVVHELPRANFDLLKRLIEHLDK